MQKASRSGDGKLGKHSMLVKVQAWTKSRYKCHTQANQNV